MRTLAVAESDLLLALHDGPFEQSLWQTFLELLLAMTGASYAGLYFRPDDTEAAMHLFAGEALPAHLQRLMNDRYDGLPVQHDAMREGRVYGLEELVDRDDPVQRAFLDDVLIPGGVRHMRSVRVMEPGGTDAWLTIISDRSFPAAAGSLLSRLVPHFRSALRSFVSLERERMRSSISSEAMSRLNFGWLTLDAQCRILDTTPHMAEIFRRTSLVRRGRYDRLSFRSIAIDREVGSLVKYFARGVEARPRAFNLSKDPWMDIFVAPVKGRLRAPGSTAVAIVYLSGDRHSRNDRCEQLVDLFGLLPSEARLAWAIAQSRSIGEAAQELGITIETARNYSKKIYSKTGASGQAELVRIIFTSVLAII
jgi:DNA-binding CsgD family transcriptional regulator